MKQPSKFFIMGSYTANTGDIAILNSLVKSLECSFKSDQFFIEVSHPAYVLGRKNFKGKKIFSRIIAVDKILDSNRSLVKKIGDYLLGLYRLSIFPVWILFRRIGISLDFLVSKEKLAYLKLLKEADLVIIPGGSVLQSKYRFKLHLYKYFLVFLLGKKIVSVGQTIGPIKSSFSRWLTSLLLNKFELIQIREVMSWKYIGENFPNIKKKCLTSDMASLLEAKNKLPDDKRVTFCIKQCVRQDDYVIKVSQVLKYLIHKGFEINLISHDPANDKIIDRVYELLFDKNVIEKFYFSSDLDKVLDIYASSRFVISNRMHGTIFALLHNCPFIALNYQYKFDGFLKTLDYPNRLNIAVETFLKDNKKIYDAFEYMVQNEQSLKSNLSKKMLLLRKRAYQNIINIKEMFY